MSTALSFKNRLAAWLKRRNMPAQTFAELLKLDGLDSGASQAKIFSVLRDPHPSADFKNDVIERLSPLLVELENMCLKFEPVPLDLRDAEKVHQLLTQFRGERIFVLVLCELLSGKDGEVYIEAKRIRRIK